jgi:hypothetical protein
VLEGEANARVILLKAQAESQALQLLAAVLKENPGLLTYRYIDKLSPSLKAMLIPSNNPLILPVPDLGLGEEGATTLSEGGTGITSTLQFDITPVFTPTLTLTPTPTAVRP